MANISMKRVVADALANYLSANIAGLAGKVSAVAAGPDTNAPCLALKILPNDMRFEPTDATEAYEAATDDGKLVLDVGQFTGQITMQLFTVSPAERELYEQLILDLFLATPWAPGTLYINTPNLIINGYASLYSAEFKVFLDSESWNDEMAFEAKRYSFMELEVDFPALTALNAVNLTSLQVALANTDSPIASIADIDPSLRVELNADGTTTKGTL